ncbi:50S ribosomal protein L44e [uncultured archaeon]|nr:50S ribosomal protein L44e [uncultured archaeon]
MKIENEINTYCPYCQKHTEHKVKTISKGPVRGLGWHTRSHERKIHGYTSSVSVRLKPKKLGKKQAVLLECKVCKKSVQRTFGARAKKKIEIKR